MLLSFPNSLGFVRFQESTDGGQLKIRSYAELKKSRINMSMEKLT
jgi:hypothetical protein